jgi:plastocyanin
MLAFGCSLALVLIVLPGLTRALPSHVRAGATMTVRMEDFRFNPQTLGTATQPIPVGTTVTWTNFGHFAHTTTSDKTPPVWNSSADPRFVNGVPPGQSFSFTFTAPGTYPYHCIFHQSLGMVGTIIVGTPARGALSGSSAADTTRINLTTEGVVDWAHWGFSSATSFEHRAGTVPQIGTFSLPAGGTPLRAALYPPGFSWTNGTPIASATTTTGVLLRGVLHTFQVTAPAGLGLHILKVYVGVFKAQGQLRASLSDGSAAPFVDRSLNNATGASNRVFTLTYHAATNGQKLIVQWLLLADHGAGTGDSSLQAATLR